MAGSCREAILEVQVTIPNVPEWWEDLLDVREWLRGHLGCPGRVGRPFRMSGSGREAIPDV